MDSFWLVLVFLILANAAMAYELRHEDKLERLKRTRTR